MVNCKLVVSWLNWRVEYEKGKGEYKNGTFGRVFLQILMSIIWLLSF